MSINVAIIGYGLSAKAFHNPFITTTPGLTLHSIVQCSPTATGSVSKTTKLSKPTLQPQSFTCPLVQVKYISLVIIATSNTTHLLYCKEAIENGKNVVVEKQFTTSSKGADELIALAGKTGKTMAVFSVGDETGNLETERD